jgi:hypothetical protein
MLLNMKHAVQNSITKKLCPAQFEQDAALDYWSLCDRDEDFKRRKGIEGIWITDAEGRLILGREDWWKYSGVRGQKSRTSPEGGHRGHRC